jgi:hypothetical protein
MYGMNVLSTSQILSLSKWAEPTSFYDCAVLSLLLVAGTQSMTIRELYFVYGMDMEAALPWDHVQMQRRLRDGRIDFKLELRKLRTRSRDRMDSF